MKNTETIMNSNKVKQYSELCFLFGNIVRHDIKAFTAETLTGHVIISQLLSIFQVECQAAFIIPLSGLWLLGSKSRHWLRRILNMVEPNGTISISLSDLPNFSGPFY